MYSRPAFLPYAPNELARPTLEGGDLRFGPVAGAPRENEFARSLPGAVTVGSAPSPAPRARTSSRGPSRGL